MMHPLLLEATLVAPLLGFGAWLSGVEPQGRAPRAIIGVYIGTFCLRVLSFWFSGGAEPFGSSQIAPPLHIVTWLFMATILASVYCAWASVQAQLSATAFASATTPLQKRSRRKATERAKGRSSLGASLWWALAFPLLLLGPEAVAAHAGGPSPETAYSEAHANAARYGAAIVSLARKGRPIPQGTAAEGNKVYVPVHVLLQKTGCSALFFALLGVIFVVALCWWAWLNYAGLGSLSSPALFVVIYTVVVVVGCLNFTPQLHLDQGFEVKWGGGKEVCKVTSKGASILVYGSLGLQLFWGDTHPGSQLYPSSQNDWAVLTCPGEPIEGQRAFEGERLPTTLFVTHTQHGTIRLEGCRGTAYGVATCILGSTREGWSGAPVTTAGGELVGFVQGGVNWAGTLIVNIKPSQRKAAPGFSTSLDNEL